jgi:hypothetical protein
MKKTLIIAFAATLVIGSIAFSGCSTKKSDTKTESVVAKYADNQYYDHAIDLLKSKVKLSDKEADDAFNTFMDCEIVTDNLNYIFDGQEKGTYTFWFGLSEFDVTFADNKVTKISTSKGPIYENGKRVETASTKSEEKTTSEVATQQAENSQIETAAAISFVDYTDRVIAGEKASVTVQGEPNTDYTIHVMYDSGESKAGGLDPKTSDDNGVVSWEWEVGANTNKGTASISVSGGGATAQTTFEVI